MTRHLLASLLILIAAVPGSAADRPGPLPATAALRFAAPSTITVTAPSARPLDPDVFGTVALDAGVTVYGARWRRVSAADERDPRILQIAAAAAGRNAVDKIAFIQSAVTRRIGWRRDLDVYHVSDYWAQAGETLDRGYGDSEDIAIVKMQALKAAGFSPRDIYLSIGRDRQRGADTLLLVRAGERFYALDDHSAGPLTADRMGRFTPVLTLGRNGAWLHGTRYTGGAASRGRPIQASLGMPR